MARHDHCRLAGGVGRCRWCGSEYCSRRTLSIRARKGGGSKSELLNILDTPKAESNTSRGEVRRWSRPSARLRSTSPAGGGGKSSNHGNSLLDGVERSHGRSCSGAFGDRRRSPGGRQRGNVAQGKFEARVSMRGWGSPVAVIAACHNRWGRTSRRDVWREPLWRPENRTRPRDAHREVRRGSFGRTAATRYDGDRMGWATPRSRKKTNVFRPSIPWRKQARQPASILGAYHADGRWRQCIGSSYLSSGSVG